MFRQDICAFFDDERKRSCIPLVVEEGTLLPPRHRLSWRNGVFLMKVCSERACVDDEDEHKSLCRYKRAHQ